ncbi:MAG: hypothetical protein MUC71_12460 [Steroidobacteraceae bacterium]|jgi:hypothetical protein|nr:hypothetical protein [Steroidobacteraceae bacterium]
MWQTLLVIFTVAASAAYSAWSLLPPATRRRLRLRLSMSLERMPPPVAALGRALRPPVAPAATGCAACPASALHGKPPSRR